MGVGAAPCWGLGTRRRHALFHLYTCGDRSRTDLALGVGPGFVSDALDTQLEVLRGEIDQENYEKWFVPAGRLISNMVLREDYPAFLTLSAYDLMEGSK